MGAFRELAWQWPREIIRPLAEALSRRTEEVDRAEHDFASLQLATLHFDGTMEPRALRGREDFKGRLYFAHAGDVIYSKIDVRNGAIGIVPPEMPRAAVSAEYPVYRVDIARTEPEYIQLLFRTTVFRARLNALVSGASGRKRVNPEDLEALEVPLPPLATQRAIVARWREAQARIAAARERAERIGQNADAAFLADLGLCPPKKFTTSKCLAASWTALVAWSGRATALRDAIGDIHAGKFPIVRGRDFLLDVCHGCSAAPSPMPTSLEVVKISAVTRGEFQPSEKKFAPDVTRFRDDFSLRKGDVLLCRTNGTLGYVGMSALVAEDQPNLIFPDKVIRVRCRENILPEFLWRVLQTPYLRQQIESAARTAVGNYAIGGKDIWDFKIPLPQLAGQRALVARVAAARAEVARERAEAARLATAIAAETEALLLGTRSLHE